MTVKARRTVMAIDGISRVPMRTIAIRTSQGLELKSRTQPAFQSRRERAGAIVKAPIQRKGPATQFTGVSFTRLRSKRKWLRAGIVATAGTSLIYVPVGLTFITGLLIYELCTKRRSRTLFQIAFLLSLLTPIFVLFGVQKTTIAKNAAIYLSVLLAAALVVLIINKGKNNTEEL